MIFITYYEFLALVKCQCPAHRPYCQHLDLGLQTLAPRFRSRSLVFKGPDDNAGGSRNHEGSILGRPIPGTDVVVLGSWSWSCKSGLGYTTSLLVYHSIVKCTAPAHFLLQVL